ncbi:MAG: hypothetical protein RBR20_14885 [Desulfobacterales bacterium]|jgi:hypothetical protein|nr:hypothetical protein [Desulfobacterales bacterium]
MTNITKAAYTATVYTDHTQDCTAPNTMGTVTRIKRRSKPTAGW